MEKKFIRAAFLGYLFSPPARLKFCLTLFFHAAFLGAQFYHNVLPLCEVAGDSQRDGVFDMTRWLQTPDIL
jgi:hypothetical protein